MERAMSAMSQLPPALTFRAASRQPKISNAPGWCDNYAPQAACSAAWWLGEAADPSREAQGGAYEV
ncbi:hypothetical protein HaLaN_09494, partial [Haematococcus lacustris]